MPLTLQQHRLVEKHKMKVTACMQVDIQIGLPEVVYHGSVTLTFISEDK